jgi:hypothetical protein
VSYDELVDAGSMAEAKARGKVRIEGKDYVMAGRRRRGVPFQRVTPGSDRLAPVESLVRARSGPGRLEHMFERVAGGDAPAGASPTAARPVTDARRCGRGSSGWGAWTGGSRTRSGSPAGAVGAVEVRRGGGAGGGDGRLRRVPAGRAAGGGVPAGKAGCRGGGAGGAGPAGLPGPRRPLPRAAQALDLGAAGHVGGAAGGGRLGVAGHLVAGRRRVWTRPTGGRRTPSWAGAGRAGGPGGAGRGAGGRVRLDPRAFVDRTGARPRTGR